MAHSSTSTSQCLDQVCMICYLYFLIIISVINVPFSVLLTFLSINILVVDRLWFVCQPDEDASQVFLTKLAAITNFTQTALLYFKSRVTSTIFSMKNCSLKANKFLKMNKVTTLRLLRITQCYLLFSYLIY